MQEAAAEDFRQISGGDRHLNLIKEAFAHNHLTLPHTYTIHVENLFNIREKNSSAAQKLVHLLHGGDTDEFMYKRRELKDSYRFVIFAWGKVEGLMERQQEFLVSFPNAIKVHRRNRGNEIEEVDYPVHALYENTDFFLDSSLGKIIE